MAPEQIARDHFDYIDGLLSGHYDDDDAPDGAWFQRCVDCIEFAQLIRNIPKGDAHDIFMAWMEEKEDDA